MEHLSTQALTEQLDSPYPGKRREAEYLLKLDTPEQRMLAKRAATRQRNMTGSRWSDAIWDSVGSILDGRLTEESWAASTKRLQETTRWYS